MFQTISTKILFSKYFPDKWKYNSVEELFLTSFTIYYTFITFTVIRM